MNHLHLQETAKYYARLAEETQTKLQEEQELNETLVEVIDVLCEELGISAKELLNERIFNKSNILGLGKLEDIVRGVFRGNDKERHKQIIGAANNMANTRKEIMRDQPRVPAPDIVHSIARSRNPREVAIQSGVTQTGDQKPGRTAASIRSQRGPTSRSGHLRSVGIF